MLTEKLKSIARVARHLPDRLLHPWRRQSAQQRLTKLPPRNSVLFVCHGNICRSPYGAARARRLLPTTITVDSAGFIGPDRPSPAEAVAVAAERGIDLAPHRSQLIAAEHLRTFDVIFVMSQEQRHRLISSQQALASRVVLLGDLDPEPITRRTVLDPVEQPAEIFRLCYDRIDRCVGVLAALWQAPSDSDSQSESGNLE